MTEPLVAVKDLTKTFEAPTAVGTSTSLASRVGGFLEQTNVEETGIEEAAVKEGVIRAVDDLDFNILDGEILGLVGESGCGKSTVARCMLRLIEPDRGEIRFDARPILDLNGKDLKAFRQQAQMVFQDPMASLNPRMTLGRSISHGLKIHDNPDPEVLREITLNVMEKVGLAPALYFYNKFPHQISGGQRQRVVIARALITNPDLVLADEPIAMADVSVRALLLDLMIQLKEEFSLTYLFITHDLATAKYICDRIGIMYLGQLVEIGELEHVYTHPLHPYTQALLAAVPVPDPHKRRTDPMPEGEIPNPINPPSGCRFHPRCTIAEEICNQKEPVLRELESGHRVACHFAEKFI